MQPGDPQAEPRPTPDVSETEELLADLRADSDVVMQAVDSDGDTMTVYDHHGYRYLVTTFRPRDEHADDPIVEELHDPGAGSSWMGHQVHAHLDEFRVPRAGDNGDLDLEERITWLGRRLAAALEAEANANAERARLEDLVRHLRATSGEF